MDEYTILANGTTLHVRSAGEGDPLFLIHGFPQNSHAWDQIIPLLSKRYKVYAVDLRGMGESAISNSGQDKRNLAKDIKDVFDYFKITKAIVVGYDIGGWIAQRFALDYPELTASLICISTSHIGNVPAAFYLSAKQLRRSWYIFFFQLPVLPEVILPKLSKHFLKAAFKHAKHEKNYAKLLEENFKECEKQLTAERCIASLNLYRTLSLDRVVNYNDRHVVFKMPVLWLQGSNDPFIPSVKENNLNRFYLLEIKEFENKGHWLLELAPQEVTQAIFDFLEKAPSPV